MNEENDIKVNIPKYYYELAVKKQKFENTPTEMRQLANPEGFSQPIEPSIGPAGPLHVK